MLNIAVKMKNENTIEDEENNINNGGFGSFVGELFNKDITILKWLCDTTCILICWIFNFQLSIEISCKENHQLRWQYDSGSILMRQSVIQKLSGVRKRLQNSQIIQCNVYYIFMFIHQWLYYTEINITIDIHN